jgi:predicted nuclease of predicted toxin-antitoxin system
MIWVEAHISPAVAKWVSAELGHPACSIRALGLRNAKDKDIPDLAASTVARTQ